MNAEQLEYCRKNRWIVNRQGQEFITFKGLLWMAHQMGLTSLISTPVREDYEHSSLCFERKQKACVRSQAKQ